jgi:hypothetical protein
VGRAAADRRGQTAADRQTATDSRGQRSRVTNRIHRIHSAWSRTGELSRVISGNTHSCSIGQKRCVSKPPTAVTSVYFSAISPTCRPWNKWINVASWLVYLLAHTERERARERERERERERHTHANRQDSDPHRHANTHTDTRTYDIHTQQTHTDQHTDDRQTDTQTDREADRQGTQTGRPVNCGGAALRRRSVSTVPHVDDEGVAEGAHVGGKGGSGEDRRGRDTQSDSETAETAGETDTYSGQSASSHT